MTRLTQLLGPGRTFFDLDQIAPGMDFKVQIKRVLGASKVLLALIGPKWETVSDSNGKPRLGDRNDLVRVELLSALKSKKVRVVPILLNRDTVPKKDDLPHVLHPNHGLQSVYDPPRPVARGRDFITQRTWHLSIAD